jgi:antitoxin VapB
MGLSIKNERTESLVRQLAKRDNVSMTAAITLAVNNELKQRSEASAEVQAKRRQSMIEIQAMLATMQVVESPLTADEILGYGEDGLPV